MQSAEELRQANPAGSASSNGPWWTRYDKAPTRPRRRPTLERLRDFADDSNRLEVDVRLDSEHASSDRRASPTERIRRLVYLLTEALEHHAPLTVYYGDASTSVGGVHNTAVGAHLAFPQDRLAAGIGPASTSGARAAPRPPAR